MKSIPMIINLITISIVIGILEGQLLYRAGTTGRKIILNHFSLYHFFLLVLFILIPTIAGFKEYWSLLGIMIVIQDAASKLNPQLKWYKSGDWALWPLDRLYIGLPWWYIVLPVLFYFTNEFIK